MGGSEQDDGEIAMVEKRLIVFKEPFLTKFTIGDPQEWSIDHDNGNTDPNQQGKCLWGIIDG